MGVMPMEHSQKGAIMYNVYDYLKDSWKKPEPDDLSLLDSYKPIRTSSWMIEPEPDVSSLLDSYKPLLPSYNGIGSYDRYDSISGRINLPTFDPFLSDKQVGMRLPNGDRMINNLGGFDTGLRVDSLGLIRNLDGGLNNPCFPGFGGGSPLGPLRAF